MYGGTGCCSAATGPLQSGPSGQDCDENLLNDLWFYSPDDNTW